MLRRCMWFISIAALAIWVSSAVADSPPPPGSREREAAETIRKGGYACPRVAKLEGAPTNTPHYDEMIWGSAHPQVATCTNKRRFFFAHRPKRGAKQATPPNPMVRPL